VVIVLTRLAILFLMPLAAACTADQEPPGPPYRADVLDIVASDPDTGLSSFEIAERELGRLEDLDRLEGPDLTVRRGGELIVRQVNGSVVLDGRFEAAEEPRLRYAVEDGAVVPLDYPTLTMLSAYHHFSTALDQTEAISGLSVDDIVDRVGRVEVFFEPRLRFEAEVSTTGTSKLNAFYLPPTRQFGLAQRAQVEGIPIAANPKVIAHEFGHALFDHLFFDGATGVCVEEEAAGDPLSASRLSTEYAISGFNEGTGDFVSFVITGSASPLEEIVRADLVEPIAEERTLLVDNFVFDDLQGSDRPCDSSFYCIGTLWARSLYRAMIERGGDPRDAADRAAYARQVLAALAGARAAMADQDLLPEPNASVVSCSDPGSNPDYDAEVSSAVLAAFLGNMPPEERPALCGQLAERFGETGFSAEARAAAACPEVGP
jgi:hypothetical protein